MILQFWLATIILLIIVSVFAAVPFLKIKKEGKQEYNTRNQLNRSLYEIRLLELERDAEQGMLSDKSKMLTELQYNLLDDIDDNQEIKKPARSKLVFLPGLFLLIVGSLALYSRVGAYEEVQHWQNTLQRYPALQRQLFKDSDTEATEQNLRDIMLGLRTNLQDNSEDPQGWLLYARLGMIFENTDLALDAISKAYSLDPKSVDIRLLYIQLSMQTGDDFLQQQAQLMLTQLLKEIPNNVDAWSMSAFMALGDKDYSRAIFSWKRLLQIVSPNTKQARILKDSINYAQKKLSILKTNRLSVPNKMNKSTLEKGHYRVKISLTKEVVVPKNGTLFVYAQAINGASMPIAAIKILKPIFPLNIEISDENSMLNDLKLSSHDQFTITARLSIDANVNNKKGQWQGRSAVVEKDQRTPVIIIINNAL